MLHDKENIILRAVIGNRLDMICGEMGLALERSSRSPFSLKRAILLVEICDAEGNLFPN